mmetsp:Transcript_58565/g.132589  ORF Transcript_58565/g.132589 Transcript_58565/m.132589 type:complete len:305 (+) Transcript_58565:73-987(+)
MNRMGAPTQQKQAHGIQTLVLKKIASGPSWAIIAECRQRSIASWFDCKMFSEIPTLYAAGFRRQLLHALSFLLGFGRRRGSTGRNVFERVEIEPENCSASSAAQKIEGSRKRVVGRRVESETEHLVVEEPECVELEVEQRIQHWVAREGIPRVVVHDDVVISPRLQGVRPGACHFGGGNLVIDRVLVLDLGHGKPDAQVHERDHDPRIESFTETRRLSNQHVEHHAIPETIGHAAQKVALRDGAFFEVQSRGLRLGVVDDGPCHEGHILLEVCVHQQNRGTHERHCQGGSYVAQGLSRASPLHL